MKSRLIIIMAFLAVACWAPGALADTYTYSFFNITNNNPADAGIGEAQLFVDVADAGNGQVNFHFYNTGPAASSITDIYFDDGTLLGIASINNGTGVAFSQGASPGDLPGGDTLIPPFITTAGFLADSDPPAQPSGVNPKEFVDILFNLREGGSFADVLAELSSGELRIGIHVQGFASGGSESYVNNGLVPVPPTVLLLGSGLLGLGLLGWRRKKRQ